MKRPATDPPEVEPFRPRRRFEAPQLASSLNLGDRPHPNRVSDDERALSPTQILPKANTNISQVMQHPSMNGLFHYFASFPAFPFYLLSLVTPF